MAAATNVRLGDSSGSPQQFPGVFSRVWKVRAALDPANVTNGATGTATDTVTVPGVVLGDHVFSFALGLDQAGVVRTAYVSAADTVTVVAQNLTGGAVNMAATEITLVIGRPAF